MEIPRHVAIIPDGNRRWAREHGLPTFEGHRRGFDSLKTVGDWLRSKGVHTLTLWGFSTENWSREREEISYLMRIYKIWINKYVKTAVKDRMRIIHLGRKDRLPKPLLDVLNDAEAKTSSFTAHTLGIALDYGGRDEIVRAVQRIRESGAPVSTEEDFSRYLDTKDFTYPYPDLVVRTSGEQRVSGFLPWQAAYSEYIFVPKYLPDFGIEDMRSCLEEYGRRQRRYGK